MDDLVKQLIERHRNLRQELRQSEDTPDLIKVEILLSDMRKAGRFVIDPDQRGTITNLARDLAEIIFEASDTYPSIRLEPPNSIIIEGNTNIVNIKNSIHESNNEKRQYNIYITVLAIFSIFCIMIIPLWIFLNYNNSQAPDISGDWRYEGNPIIENKIWSINQNGNQISIELKDIKPFIMGSGEYSKKAGIFFYNLKIPMTNDNYDILTGTLKTDINTRITGTWEKNNDPFSLFKISKQKLGE